MSEWISLVDSFPEKLKLVLLADKEDFYIGSFDVSFEGNLVWIEHRELMTIYPTHWQPLPELPKE